MIKTMMIITTVSVWPYLSTYLPTYLSTYLQIHISWGRIHEQSLQAYRLWFATSEEIDASAVAFLGTSALLR